MASGHVKHQRTRWEEGKEIDLAASIQYPLYRAACYTHYLLPQYISFICVSRDTKSS